MAYIDYAFYSGTFQGSLIPSAEFAPLAESAGEIIDSIITSSPDSSASYYTEFKKAVAYQAEMLYSHGSKDAEAGLTAALGGYTEKIGDFSIGNNRVNTDGCRIYSLGGIPVSGITVGILRRLGLMSRLARGE